MSGVVLAAQFAEFAIARVEECALNADSSNDTREAASALAKLAARLDSAIGGVAPPPGRALQRGMTAPNNLGGSSR